MITHDLTAADLIDLGRSSLTLENATNWNAVNFVTMRDSFVALLKRCGFQATSAASQSIAQLQILQDSLGRVHGPLGQEIKSMFTAIYHTLYHEAQRTAVILTNVEPPPELLDLKNLEKHQEALRQDLIVCLKAHLARPAIVTAWALGYDILRTWVYDDQPRRASFNTQLANPPRKGEPAAIVDYHDFFTLGEVRFLEICRDSQDMTLKDFTAKTFRTLQALLDQRNDFAHANYSQANEHEANAYVVRLLRVVTRPPFIP
jgi:hypothetical protein